FFGLHHGRLLFGVGGLIDVHVLFQRSALFFRFLIGPLLRRLIGLLGFFVLGLGFRDGFLQFLPAFLDFELHFHAVEGANIVDNGPNLFLSERVLERRHGRHGKLVVADFVSPWARVLHVAGNRIENLFILERAHFLLVGQVLRLGIGHRRPVESFVLTATFPMTMHA